MSRESEALPVRAREEICELSFYLEQALRNLREVSAELSGSSATVPDVLVTLRDVNRMTEAATVRVLEETEALVEDSRVATSLIAAVRRDAGPVIARRLGVIDGLIARSNERSMAIMAALEFQDLTSQKVQHALGVLAEVVERLRRIQGLVRAEAARSDEERPGPAVGRARSAGDPSGQALADALLLDFAGRAEPRR